MELNQQEKIWVTMDRGISHKECLWVRELTNNPLTPYNKEVNEGNH